MSNDFPLVKIVFSKQAEQDLKKLIKKYPNIIKDLTPVLDRLRTGETPGDRIPGIEYVVYKERIRNQDARKGQSGGYRLVYYLRTISKVIVITIYSKSQVIDISPTEVRRIIEDILAAEADNQADDNDAG
jgi:mRNA-degrading endonuclease RelE of RelBE toxin-antitoxin system